MNWIWNWYCVSECWFKYLAEMVINRSLYLIFLIFSFCYLASNLGLKNPFQTIFLNTVFKNALWYSIERLLIFSVLFNTFSNFYLRILEHLSHFYKIKIDVKSVKIVSFLREKKAEKVLNLKILLSEQRSKHDALSHKTQQQTKGTEKNFSNSAKWKFIVRLFFLSWVFPFL